MKDAATRTPHHPLPYLSWILSHTTQVHDAFGSGAFLCLRNKVLERQIVEGKVFVDKLKDWRVGGVHRHNGVGFKLQNKNTTGNQGTGGNSNGRKNEEGITKEHSIKALPMHKHMRFSPLPCQPCWG